MSLFAELKRRNVFRVAAAYLVSAWLLIEIGSLMFDAFEFPDWASQLLITLLGLGLIPALIFAWAFELTPEGVKRESEVDRSGSIGHHTGRRLDQVTIAMILLALGVVMLQQFVLNDTDERSPRTDPTAANTAPAVQPAPTGAPPEPANFTPDPNSVAVLPFVNMSADPDNEYFSDGISEELINLLVRIEGLRVPSRTSSFAFKGRNENLSEIARSLDVAHILEGSVRKSGQRVRVTAQLIDVSSDGDHHLWSESFDRELTDIFAIQDEIAGAIIAALEMALGTAPARPARPRDIGAYDLYLQGLHLFRQREDKLIESEKLLRQAVESDPELAEAWATLALVYTVQPYYVDVSRDFAGPQARQAAERALALDPTLADPRAVSGLLLQWDERWAEALAGYQSLVADHPRHALSRTWYGITLLIGGYVDESIEQFQTGYDLDPASGVAIDWLARARFMAGDTEDAVKLARRAVQFDRDEGLITLSQHFLGSGRRDAFAQETQALPATNVYRHLSRALAGPDEAERVLKNLGDSTDDRFLKADIHFFLQQPDRFFDAVEDGLELDETNIVSLWWPAAKPFRQHPRMKSFARDHGLLALWRERGWPDLCRPLGPEDFECD